MESSKGHTQTKNEEEKGEKQMSQYVVVDFEMCNVPKGENRRNFRMKNEIIEIGAVLLNSEFEIVDQFQTYVRPRFGVVDEYIQKLTGIHKKDTDSAPLAEEAFRAFADWIPEGAILVSWSENDEVQLRREMENKGIEIPKLSALFPSWFDCQVTFSEKMENSRRYRLYDALVMAGIDFDENIHDALVDAQNTALLFAKMNLEEEFTLVEGLVSADDDSYMYTPLGDIFKDLVFAG